MAEESHTRGLATKSAPSPLQRMGRLQTVTKKNGVSLLHTDWICHKVTESTILDKVFQPSPADHEKNGGNAQKPHKLHILTRINSTKKYPCWGKDAIKMLGLEKAHTPQVHKNIPSLNTKLKVVEQLIKIKPPKLPQGLPTEEHMSNTCLKSTGKAGCTGELLVQWHLKPEEQKTVTSSRQNSFRPPVSHLINALLQKSGCSSLALLLCVGSCPPTAPRQSTAE
ncbi:39S ribosomal protein L30, mitochondrial-like [Nycticebus coucang]|uniref:39S ribosomal protein L30, mitochondrial-like n=1 Tax=Nycticebus coucang TaxID=9470 RepID=UPI00234D19AC|nr:39S ribosomal protein L30, mitochondrial-like [Nycticebus coucang]